MAKRLVCCPVVGESGNVSLRYLYLDTLNLRAEDVTDKLAVFDRNLRKDCCFDKLVDYLNGAPGGPKASDLDLPFRFSELNSLEWFRNTDELRLKTGSEKLLYSCLLSYYRREYDGTQQHSFFSDPTGHSYRQEGVEHELTLENRVLVQDKKEEFVPETLDKGKTDAERDAEAALAQAQAELMQAAADAEKEEKKKDAKKKKRNDERKRIAEAEKQYHDKVYREFRNKDDVQSVQYQRMRQYEEEMRENNAYLASQYDLGNYSSLPGFVAPPAFAASFDSAQNQTVHYTVDSNGLFALASRLDEFGIAYTVFSAQDIDGKAQHSVCYTSDDAARAIQATEFYELEEQLRFEGVIPANAYFSAFQLQALDYAYEHYVDTSIISSGSFNGNQMIRIIEAGMQGHDMSTLANPSYSTPQMDAMVHFMSHGWDTASISKSDMAPVDIADSIIHEERSRGILDEDKFFSFNNYDSFVGYGRNYSAFDYFNDYDSAFQRSVIVKNEQSEQSAQGWENHVNGRIYQNVPAEKLIHDKDPFARLEAVRQGHGLDVLVKDDDPYVRAAVAERGYGLDVLIHDKSPIVRQAVAERGYGLDKLIHDETASVRMAVAKKGYGLDILARDGGWNVRKVAGELLRERQASQNANSTTDKLSPVKTENTYSWGAGYTPNGYTKSDSSFVPGGPTYRRRRAIPNDEVSTSSHSDRGRPQKAPPAEGLKSLRTHPLDDLQVRSNFAKRAGLRLERFGSKALDTGNRFASSSVRLVASNLVRDDETGTMSLAYKTGRNASLVAHLVMDVPRMYAKSGKGVSYTSHAIQSAKGSGSGQKGQAQVALPLRVNAWKAHIASAEEKHYHSLKKQFGEKAASLSVKEIDNQISSCSIDLASARNKIVPVNQKLKVELKSLHPSAVLTAEKSELILANRKLKAEIKALQKKDSLSSIEKKTLEKKIQKKLANEKAIGKKAKTIKEHGPVDRKSVKKAAELLKQKKQNEAILAKHGRRLKDLNRLKNKKLGFQYEKKRLDKILNKAYAAENRLKSIPGILTNKLVEKLYQSGDRTLSGIGQATGYAMSFAQNPITRLALRSMKKIFVKSKKKAKPPSPDTKVKPPRTSANKTAATPQKAIRRVTKPKVRAQKADTKLINRTRRIIGQRNAAAGKTLLAKSKGVALWIKQTRKKAIAAISKAFQSAVAMAKGIISGAASFASSASAAAAAGGGLLFVLIIIVIIALSSSMSSASTSFVLTPEGESSDKIDLSPYIEKINGYQMALEDDITAIANGVSSETGKEYDNVFYDYTGKNNTLHIITMAYVRFGFDLGSDKEAVDAYIEQLYKDSNYVDYIESELYSCDDGCVERQYYCYDEPDEFATNTRKALYAASDHSDEYYVGDSEDEYLGCKYKTYSCMKKGHDIYNEYGCFQHNDGYAMSERGKCNNYTKEVEYEVSDDGTLEEVVYYYCDGHCSMKHRDYYCPKHTETVCYGDHQDLNITINSLVFDDIFNADTSLASSGSLVKGEAYEGTFVISAYCKCHACCHVTASGKVLCAGEGTSDCKNRIANSTTASGVSPKAKHTLAVDADNPVVPMGTHVWIDGVEYVVEDTGGFGEKGRDFDMYFDSHIAASQWGIKPKTVYKSVKISDDGEGNSGDQYGFEGWTEDNIAIVKNIYEIMVSDDADEIYKGLDGIKILSYGGYSGNYDFSELVFDELDMNSLTKYQKAILQVIESNKAPTKAGYCQAWVADVYMYATGSRDSRCCAAHSGEAWGASTDWSKIQVGASVYGYSGCVYGHVGIYIGNGLVAHNIGYLKIDSLETWVRAYDGVCWGWNGAQNLTGNSDYDCKPRGTFMRGRH